MNKVDNSVRIVARNVNGDRVDISLNKHSLDANFNDAYRLLLDGTIDDEDEILFVSVCGSVIYSALGCGIFEEVCREDLIGFFA